MPEIKDQLMAAAEAAQFGSTKSRDTSRDGTPMTENGDSKPKDEVIGYDSHFTLFFLARRVYG